MKRLYALTVTAQRRGQTTMTVCAMSATIEGDPFALDVVNAILVQSYRNLPLADYTGHTVTNIFDMTDAAVRFVADEVATRTGRPWLEAPPC